MSITIRKTVECQIEKHDDICRSVILLWHSDKLMSYLVGCRKGGKQGTLLDQELTFLISLVRVKEGWEW